MIKMLHISPYNLGWNFEKTDENLFFPSQIWSNSVKSYSFPKIDDFVSYNALFIMSLSFSYTKNMIKSVNAFSTKVPFILKNATMYSGLMVLIEVLYPHQ